MECAICFDDLGAARATLGCNHSFHIRCLTGWFYQQNMGSEMEEDDVQEGKTISSCPCCRAKPAELDDIPFSRMVTFLGEEEDDEEEGDDEEDEEDGADSAAADDEVAQLLSDAARALRVSWVRTGEGRWERVVDAAGAPPVAAEPAVWDGIADRSTPPPDSLTEQISDAARKIQAVWRGFATRRTYTAH